MSEIPPNLPQDIIDRSIEKMKRDSGYYEAVANFPKPHPAPFSDTILEAIAQWMGQHLRKDITYNLLDPFAGIGKVHSLKNRIPNIESIGIEIEPEWACQHPNNVLGDSTNIQFNNGTFQLVVTSPAYGNRMSDHHNAQEKCKICNGTGVYGILPCTKCGGLGKRQYKRITYKHYIGRDLDPHNSGMMPYGKKYQELHERVWQETARVMDFSTDELDCLWFLNVSNFMKGDTIIEVSEWHRDYILSLGYELVDEIEVETPRMRFGANREKRVDHETIYVFKKLPCRHPRSELDFADYGDRQVAFAGYCPDCEDSW